MRAAFNHRDLNEPDVSVALPNGAATVTSMLIRVATPGYPVVDPFELTISAPALTTAEQPDGKTLTYSLVHDDDPAGGTATVIDGYQSLFVQTGAGGAGAAAKSDVRVRLPSTCKAYVGLRAVGSAAGNSSTKSATIGRRW